MKITHEKGGWGRVVKPVRERTGHVSKLKGVILKGLHFLQKHMLNNT